MNATELLAVLRPTLPMRMLTTRQLAILALAAEARQPIDFAVGALNLQISKPAMSRNIDSLQDLKLVARTFPNREDEDGDWRRVFVGITPEGWKLLNAMGVTK